MLPLSLSLVGAHDVFTEGEARNGNHFNVGDGERNTDDRDRLKNCRDEVAKGQNPARQEKPDDVHEPGPGPSPRFGHNNPAKWPKHEIRDPQACDSCGQGDDEYNGEDADDKILEEEDESSKYEPDQVEHDAHGDSLRHSRF